MSKHTIQEQIAYYRARATEYDEWFYRVGRYDHGKELNQQWFSEADAVTQELLNSNRYEHILELACGTGIWTEQLHKIADHITAIDTSPEVIAINKEKLQADNITYVQADLFQWEPDQQYDMVYFSFWLSHVPPELLSDFLGKVHRALKTGGRLFILDSRKTPSSSAKDHIIPEASEILSRRLNDGREFVIVKIFYEPLELANTLNQAGFDMKVVVTPNYFIYANGIKRGYGSWQSAPSH